MITPDKLGGDADIARRVLVRARTIAPCIDFFDEESEEYKNTIAILKGVISALPDPGYSRAKSVSRNGTSITFSDIRSAFTPDDVTSLRSLCGAVSANGMPSGSFPDGHLFEQLWPDEVYP